TFFLHPGFPEHCRRKTSQAALQAVSSLILLSSPALTKIALEKYNTVTNRIPEIPAAPHVKYLRLYA
ncbi:MAG: hypothetical protein ACR2PH_10650, partial [Desulfobulbia bacterium]